MNEGLTKNACTCIICGRKVEEENRDKLYLVEFAGFRGSSKTVTTLCADCKRDLEKQLLVKEVKA